MQNSLSQFLHSILATSFEQQLSQTYFESKLSPQNILHRADGIYRIIMFPGIQPITVDRIITIFDVMIHKFQELSVKEKEVLWWASLSIGIKIDENHANIPNHQDLIIQSGVSADEFFEQEMKIFKIFNFKINFTTPYEMIEIFLIEMSILYQNEIRYDENTKRLMRNSLNQCWLQYPLTGFKASSIALGILIFQTDFINDDISKRFEQRLQDNFQDFSLKLEEIDQVYTLLYKEYDVKQQQLEEIEEDQQNNQQQGSFEVGISVSTKDEGNLNNFQNQYQNCQYNQDSSFGVEDQMNIFNQNRQEIEEQDREDDKEYNVQNYTSIESNLTKQNVEGIKFHGYKSMPLQQQQSKTEFEVQDEDCEYMDILSVDSSYFNDNKKSKQTELDQLQCLEDDDEDNFASQKNYNSLNSTQTGNSSTFGPERLCKSDFKTNSDMNQKFSPKYTHSQTLPYIKEEEQSIKSCQGTSKN